MSVPEQTLTAWGRSSISTSRVFAPTDAAAAASSMQVAHERGIIARGLGRSYGDQCLNDRGDVIQTTALQTVHSFDTQSGLLHCDAGVSFAQLMEPTLAAGWMPPVCPGTAFVSIGGAIANDVHGKNHHYAGTFTDHVTWFDLLLPNGSVHRVSPTSDPDLFYATVGGIGLTGVILSAQFQLQRAAVNALEMTQSRVHNLDAFLHQLPEASAQNEYAVGWIDAMHGGATMGRGVLEIARRAESSVEAARPHHFRVPFDFPAWTLNRLSVGAFNELYFRRIPSAGQSRRIHLNNFLYPLDAILDWNRMYGSHGVYQFQCALPYESSSAGLREIMQAAVRSHSASFLAVIKCMGRAGRGLLSFTLPGFSLALDFPRRPATFALIRRLHEIVLNHGGRIYLAKDSCLSADEFARMYPTVAAFTRVLDRVDPTRVMQSDMSRRLGLR